MKIDTVEQYDTAIQRIEALNAVAEYLSEFDILVLEELCEAVDDYEVCQFNLKRV